MLLGDIPPEVKIHSVILFQLNRLLQGEKNWEPGEHARRVGGWQDGDHNFFVEETLEISSEPMKNAI